MLADRHIILLIAVATLAGCDRGDPPAAVGSASPPVEVRIASTRTTPSSQLTLPARVRASEEVTLTSRAPGRVTRLLALEGASVRAGQVIVRFDAPEAVQALSAGLAARDAAQLALEVATRQHARMESLFVSQIVAAAEREAAAAQHRAAGARLATAEAQLSATRAAIEVRAPFDGIVVRRHVDAGADVSTGSPLVDLRSLGAAELLTSIPEAALALLASAHFQFQIGDGPWQGARLARLDGMTDAATRTRNAHLLPLERVSLEPGAFARVRIVGIATTAGATNLLSVPTSSVVRRGALTGVFIVQRGHAMLRWLRLGRTEGTRTEVLAGLEASDAVIQTGSGLTDGAAVKLVQ